MYPFCRHTLFAVSVILGQCCLLSLYLMVWVFLKPQLLKTADYMTLSAYFVCNKKVLSLLTEEMSFKVSCQILKVSIRYDCTVSHTLALSVYCRAACILR